MTALADIIAGLTEDAGSCRLDAPEDWLQGRTLYGGLAAALAVEATRRAVAGLGPLRSAHFAFVAPAAGPLTITPRVLRTGRSVTFVSVDVLTAAGEVAMRALLCFGAPRRSALSHRALPMPPVPPPGACPALLGSGDGPVFLQHFDARATGDARFGGGRAEPEISAWFRHRDAAGVDAVVALIALGDVSPPAPLVMLDRLVPISTMTWSLELGPEPDRGGGGGWRLLELVGEVIADGYAAERITIWAEDGTPLMTARQSVAIFA